MNTVSSPQPFLEHQGSFDINIETEYDFKSKEDKKNSEMQSIFDAAETQT